MKTLVVQAWAGERPRFVDDCLATVRAWAELQGFDYRFESDGLLAEVPEWFRERVSGFIVPMANLGRLLLLRRALQSGYDRAVWCDADVVMFDPERLHLRGLPEFALTHEVWSRPDADGVVRHEVRITGSFMSFDRENPFLDFVLYAVTARVKREPITEPRANFTRFLTPLGEVVPLHTMREVGLVSPFLMDEIARGTDRHLADYMQVVGAPLCGINLNTALRDVVHAGVHLTDSLCESVIERCLTTQGEVFNRHLSVR